MKQTLKTQNKIIFLVGPTGVGKTKLSLLLAKKIDAEIISADSMQIYKGLNIATAKPTPLELKEIPHHLINILRTNQEFDVAQYVDLVQTALTDIQKRGKKVIIVGGTGMYVNALLNGIFSTSDIDPLISRTLNSELREKGNVYLYERLTKVDSPAAEKIHQNDSKRILRALEVYQATGIPISRLQQQTKGIIDNFLIIGLNIERKELYERINHRVDEMFEQGIVEEIQKLQEMKILTGKTALQALGCKEIIGYLNKETDLLTAKNLVKRNSRRYAKRQLTWFRKDTRIHWLNGATNNQDLIDTILSLST